MPSDEAYAERRKEMAERRTRVLFQPKRLGNRWYIVKWPEGEILPVSTQTFEQAASYAAEYAAAQAVA